MDEDVAYALSLQEQLYSEDSGDRKENCRPVSPSSTGPLSIVDESWELIDPLPDIRQLFLQFNDAYFQGKLAGVEVKWSPRMTLCAGLCCYEGRGGLCSVRLSQPLLKLRPRRDLVQTLLHEMIHALLFVTNNNKDHDAHGPEFLKHMHRINKETGTQITVYHSFHDEVNVYRQHWWKCNGPCQKRPPYYGIVRRAMNRAPSPRDPWWADHQRACGGVYTKIREPEGYGKKKRTKQDKMEEKPAMSSSNGNGTLARFFRVEKKEESSRCVTDESDTNCTRSVTHQRGAGWTSIVPFSGVGQVLGTKQREPPTKSKLISSTGKLTEQGSKTSGKRPENLVSGPTKIPSPRKRRRQDSPPGLTIVDAFQKGNQKKETSTTRSSAESDISGSYLKPIVLEDSPHRDKALMLRQVSCPVCAILVPESCINQHLDSCLR